MPHSTFPGSSLESIHQQQQQPPQPLSVESGSGSCSSSSSPSPSSSSSSSPASTSPLRPSSPVLSMTAVAPSIPSPFFKLSGSFPTGKRSLSSKHMRSKSTNTPSNVGIPSLSGFSSFSSPSRQYAPPLLRSTSLPPVNTFAELGPRYTLTNTPATPTSPRSRQGPRSNSPTRQWAYSQSPLGIPRGGSSYHAGSGFPSSPSSPSPPPSYLVNEPFISSSSYSSNSSSPSTPTSTRSRSPSISSLETIPDSPDAEAEALEAEMKAALARAAAKSSSSSSSSEADEEESGGVRRRSSMDGVGRRGAMDKRKRWSVCGGEKRGDLELETIWEEAFGGGNGGADPLGIMSGDGMGDGEMI